MIEFLRHNIKTTCFLVFLPILSGVVLGISALPSQLWFLNFIAFVPLLLAVEKTLAYKRSLLIFSVQLFIALTVFYLWVGSWVLQTANMAFLIGLLILVPFIVLLLPYVLLKKRAYKYASVYFAAAWITAEMIQSYFQLGSPFFNLGHSVAKVPQLIQWYEYTGAAGGTLWVLAVNLGFYSFGKTFFNNDGKRQKKSIFLLGVLILPMLISSLMYWNYDEEGAPTEVLVVHPSTDNVDVKYRVNIYELMDIYLEIILPNLTDKTEYVVLPETAITNAGWVSEYDRNLVFQHFREKTKDFPNIKLITGAITYESIPDVTKIKNYKKYPGIRYSEKYHTWYYTYNAVLQIEHKQATQIRVKEGLVPYQEYAPYPTVLPYLSPVGIDFQFSHREPNKQIFTTANHRKTAALICYELVYGYKFARAARQGAEAFFVILNEGWYTQVEQVSIQFLQFSVIRAIENRRSIAQSSNMGISAIINQRGDVLLSTDSKKAEFLIKEIKMNKVKTLYTLTGNFIAILAIGTLVLIGLGAFMNKKLSTSNI